ncbi:class I SAM-dependent methyltransferase [Aurantibacter sp.]|uniref:class I SAM-dependent methyltransferase n=1 Tax=Aurantibacter sp. TaxID=2807103 RepID=UPI0035C7A971
MNTLTKPLLIDYFNSLSMSYSVNEFASFYLTNYMRRKLINKINNFNGKSVLDLMSGRGENLKYINNKSTKVTTIDFSYKMNIAAKLKQNNTNLLQIEDDFFNTNCKPKSFDIIVCSFGIKTINNNNLKEFSQKLNRLIKPNGEILFLEMVKPRNRFNYKFIKFYLDILLPKLFGNKFKLLFPYLNNHISMTPLKTNMINENLNIIEHKRYFDFFEIIHAKKEIVI